MGKTSFQDITGNKYGRLTVLNIYGRNNGKILWECECDCGNIVIVSGNNLKNGHTQSCGCYRRDRTAETHTTHGKRNTRLYGIWTGMKTRCYDPNCKCYKNYGGRGISMCDEWLGKDGFSRFDEWSENNGYSEDLTIDRIDTNDNYSPGNCRWADLKTQANNTRNNRHLTVNDVTRTTAEWSDITGIKSSTIRYRLNNTNLSPEEILSVPVNGGNRFK